MGIISNTKFAGARAEHMKLIFHLIDSKIISAKTGTFELMKYAFPCPDEILDNLFIEPEDCYWVNGMK